jgi:hypothetical protein
MHANLLILNIFLRYKLLPPDLLGPAEDLFEVADDDTHDRGFLLRCQDKEL